VGVRTAKERGEGEGSEEEKINTERTEGSLGYTGKREKSFWGGDGFCDG